MTPTTVWALVAGVGAGSGLLIILLALPAANQPRFSERVAPSMRSGGAGTQLFTEPGRPMLPLGALGNLFGPVLKHVLSHLAKFNTGTHQLQGRLEAANSTTSPEEYRLQQLASGGLGALVASAVNVVAWLNGSLNPLLALLSLVGLTVLGVAFRDNLLSQQIKRRQARMLAEFPTVAELVALSVSAGENAPGAFERVSAVTRGDLHIEFGRVLRETKSGTGFSRALKKMSARVQLAPIQRFLEGIIVALERGTPLAEVMRAQAQDVRDLSKRELMETAGRKEVRMLVPLVFGILPLTVIFAIFPGAAVLNIGL